MLFNLSLKNIKKSVKDYSIYFFTLVVGVMIFYIFNSVEAQNSMLVLTESKKDIVQSIVSILSYVSVFISVILGFLIVYSNNFLIKRRKKELGIYLTLGMSKRKVSTILVLETLLVGILSLGIGILFGVFLSQFLSIFTAKLFEADMSAYKFIFSSTALIKTIIYFGIIFILVMIFNVISMSRYKLINLLNAKKMNEKVKFRNKYVVFISFILAIGLLVYAYKLLFDGALWTFGNEVIYLLIAGAVGTYLLFFSAAGFFLKIFQASKKFYYKNLNIFSLKQINSRVNTTVMSTTMICLMLLLTIGILSGSLSLANVYNTSLEQNNNTDFTISILKYNCVVYDPDDGCSFEENKSNILDIPNEDFFEKDVKEYVYFNMYYSDDLTIEDLLTKSTIEQLNKDFGGGMEFDSKVPIISESDYNKILKLYGIDERIDLSSSEYIMSASIDKLIEYFKPHYSKNNPISLGSYKMIPKTLEIVNISFQNYPGPSNSGTIIVDDQVINGLVSDTSYIIGNYFDSLDINIIEDDFINNTNKLNGEFLINTKINMQNSSIGIKAIITFIGLYLGIVFAISSATILAIGQLSEASDNKERYHILKQIGADNKMIKKALFIQISVAFLIPLVVALFHAYFGLKELNGVIELLGSIDLTSNILLTTLFIVILYGGYFILTYLCSKNIIKGD